jgi:hypothetical protein
MSQKKMLFLIIIIVFWICTEAHPFEVDGFKSGMSQETVMDILSKRNFYKVVQKPGFIQADDDPSKSYESYRSYAFNFTNNKLVSVQKEFPPSMKHLIIIFDQFCSHFGKPIDSHSERSLQSFGEEYSIGFFWTRGSDLIELHYIVFPKNDQLYVIHRLR